MQWWTHQLAAQVPGRVVREAARYAKGGGGSTGAEAPSSPPPSPPLACLARRRGLLWQKPAVRSRGNRWPGVSPEGKGSHHVPRR